MGIPAVLRKTSLITATSVAIATNLIVSWSASAQTTGFVKNNGQFPPIGENGFVEIGDAGQLLSNPQIISGGPATLDFISGEIDSPIDVDLFKISLTGTTPFSAGLYSFSPGYSLLADFQLFLFDSNGKGVIANDDTPLTPGATYPEKTFDNVSALPRLLPTLLPAGDYFLGISWFKNDPVSNEGLIFPDQPFQAVVGPTGPGGNSPLSNWTGENTTGGNSYLISLSGVKPVAIEKSVPESSSTLGIVMLAALGGYSALTRKQKSLAIRNNIQ
ncbi:MULTISPECIES: DVUA0089 family protein [Cyanophyceae]|uniref:DVUA0089 family protein n=1 Tax=Cyanophyceae TaxID=3028117 RepID=UPI0016871AE9|nr:MULTISPECIES: DVUA0089 family protein [unclassified Trichocoleus]MBD1905102.1 DVUA0089 family protein [Trichocoleus sp. FACHB-832]MBD2062636.1 DVUA0089 family protein [Trichocoleus sp. FACHB-6]